MTLSEKIKNATNMQTNVDGAWKDVAIVQQRVGSHWKTIFTGEKSI